MKKLIYILMPFLILGCSEDGATTVFCDMETISGDNYVMETFGKANTQSDKSARSGKYSAAVNVKKQFALDHKINNVKKGDYVTASIWRKSSIHKGVLTLVTDKNEILVAAKKTIKKENDWGLLEITYLAEKDFSFLKFYVYNPNKEIAYFDDFSITVLQ